MAEISIIIVNFNVKYFLEQCIHSVLASTKDEQAEIIIVDNASEDGSVDYISNRFPSVQLISLSKNIGYSAANNLGARRATGSLLLFLNPDTLIPETIFNHAKSFLRQRSQVGALGFRMLDGSGKFLRESKRGRPTLWASFCKFSGFSVLFPSKKAFSGYYLGHLSEKEISEIEVVSGAAFLIEKRVFLKIAGFDERFFMYAEDIDLSQRLIEAGYRNMYLPTVTLIHFKGESSPKNKEYFTNFYGSMALFWQKNAKTPIKRAFLPLLRVILAIFSTISTSFYPIFNRERRKSKKIVPILDPTKVLHPGSTLRYEEVISVIEQKGPSMISAEGSSSMVGSPHKNQRGFAFPL